MMESPNENAAGEEQVEGEATGLAAMLLQSAELATQGERLHPLLNETFHALAKFIGIDSSLRKTDDLSLILGQPGTVAGLESLLGTNIDIPPLEVLNSAEDSSAGDWVMNETEKVKGDLLRFIALFSEVQKAWEQWDNEHPIASTDCGSPDPVGFNKRFVEFLQSSGYSVNRIPDKQRKRACFLLDNSKKFEAGSTGRGTLTWGENGFALGLMCSIVTGRGKEGLAATLKYAQRNTETLRRKEDTKRKRETQGDDEEEGDGKRKKLEDEEGGDGEKEGDEDDGEEGGDKEE